MKEEFKIGSEIIVVNCIHFPKLNGMEGVIDSFVVSKIDGKKLAKIIATNDGPTINPNSLFKCWAIGNNMKFKRTEIKLK